MAAGLAKPLLDESGACNSEHTVEKTAGNRAKPRRQRASLGDFHSSNDKYFLTLTKLALILPVLTLIALTITVFMIGSISSLAQDLDYTQDAFGCDANGKMWVAQVHRPTDWDAAYALSITLGFGRLSYTRAKALDVVWDLVFGRTSQILVVALVYRLYRRVLMRALERRTISFDHFIAMQYSTCSSSALLAYAKDVDLWWLWRRRSTMSFLTATALVLSTLYAIVVPTWLSTMTGYQAIAVPRIPIGPELSISPDDLQVCKYIVIDGGRIGQVADVCATNSSVLGKALTNCGSPVFCQRSRPC